MNHYRNTTLDIIKLFASYMVVFIHVLFYGRIGLAVDAVARFAVPLFFLVSGYYSYKITPERIKHRLSSLMRLWIFAVLFYMLYNILGFLLKHNIQDIISYFSAYTSFKNLLLLFVFNVPVHSIHLWYLLASIYVYCLFYFIVKYDIPEKLIFIISLIALLLHLFLGEFLTIFNIQTPTALVRNFALMGFPFFGLGILFNKYQLKFKKIPTSAVVVLIVFGVLETILSRYFFGKNELYIGSVFVLISLVIVFIKFPNIKLAPILTSITGCSAYIYIFHPMVSSVTKKMYTVLGLDYTSSIILQMIHPLTVCVFTTIFAYILIKIKQRLQNR